MSEDPARYDAGTAPLDAQDWALADQMRADHPDIVMGFEMWTRWANDLAQRWAIYSDDRGQLAYHLPRLVARAIVLERTYVAARLPAPAPPSAETLGRVVRSAWVAWAATQPDPPADWLAPWEQLPARIQQVDREIGMAVWFYTHQWITSPAYVAELEEAINAQARSYNSMIAELKAEIATIGQGWGAVFAERDAIRARLLDLEAALPRLRLVRSADWGAGADSAGASVCATYAIQRRGDDMTTKELITEQALRNLEYRAQSLDLEPLLSKGISVMAAEIRRLRATLAAEQAACRAVTARLDACEGWVSGARRRFGTQGE